MNTNSLSEIIPGLLYISNDLQVGSRGKLKRYGITSIINCTMDIPNYFPNDFTYLNIRIYDNLSEIIPIKKICDFVDECIHIPRLKILVHCNMGISRSCSVAIILLLYLKIFKSVDECLNYIRIRRPCVKPNPNFFNQLVWYEKNMV